MKMKESRSCTNCAWHPTVLGVTSLDQAPSQCWTCSANPARPGWTPRQHDTVVWNIKPYIEDTPAPQDETTGGLKFDTNKPRMDLLDRQWLEDVASVLGFGAQKYEAHNWRKGLQQSRLIGAALRHLHAHNSGEDMDPESGLPHLAHASCCLMFASYMAKSRPDMDDRYKGANR